VERLGPHALRLYARDGQSMLNEALEWTRARQWTTRTVRVEEGRLDDVFRTLTAGVEEEIKA
jgi:hypothetical protein